MPDTIRALRVLGRGEGPRLELPACSSLLSHELFEGRSQAAALC